MRLLFWILVFIPWSLCAQNKVTKPATEKSSVTPQGGMKVVNYDESKVPAYTLPELLTAKDGRIVDSSKEWEKIRRPEILELFTAQVFGRIPTTDFTKTITVVKEDKNAMNGQATLKLVDITISAQGKTLTIHMGLFIPNSAVKPVPAFLLICNRSPENIDFSRSKKSEFWPAEEAIARGYAIAAFDNADVDPDKDDGFKNGIHGLLDIGRTPESWGTIAAWAWGASRCVDYLVTDKQIDKQKIAVVGHSRGAKTSLWAGANDQRIKMVVCNEAGCGGSSISRRRFGETIYEINRGFPHWFCTNFRNYNNNEDALPVDFHMLMALTAPRLLYIASAEQDLWGDPRGQYLALVSSIPAFNLYKTKSTLNEVMPLLNTPVKSGNVAYHIRDGKHNLLLKDWNFFMDFADQHWKTK
jgi:hypothetical protein